MSPTSSTAKYEVRDQVAWITLNRPEAMNALNREINGAIQKAVEEATRDDDVLVLVLTGEGGRAFSAGADLKEMTQRDSSEGTSPIPSARSAPSAHRALELCPKPVIAAIDGYSLGAGLELTVFCDIRIATEKSRFGLPEPRRSLLAGVDLHNLSRMIPLGEALMIQLTGSHVTAQRAYEIGWIQAIVPDREALFAEAERIAGEIKLYAPLAVQAIKKIVKTGRSLPVEDSMKLAEPIQDFVNKTEDRLEGPKAFAEKRDPVWKMH